VVLLGSIVATLIAIATVIGLCVWKKRQYGDDEESRPILTVREEKKQPAQQKIPKDEIIIIAQMFIRSQSYGKLNLISDIGSRVDKYYFIVEKDGSGSKYFMTMSCVGSRCKVTSENKLYIKRMLESMKHPFIVPVENCDYLKDRQIFVTFRTYFKEGSLKDLIHKSKPQEKYSKKYTILTGKALNEKKIAKFGRQILEALIYLKSQKLPFYHLTTSNVMIDDNGVCRLTDYENDLIGLNVNSKLLTHVIHPTITTLDPVVCAFGAVLYEMAVGYELDSPKLDDMPNVPTKIKKILQTIFTPNTDGQSTKLEDINKLPFFSEIQLYSPWVPQNLSTDKLEQTLETTSNAALDALKPPNDNKRTRSDTSKKTVSSPTSPTVRSNSTPPPPTNAPPPPSPNNNKTSSAPAPPPPPATSNAPKDTGRTQLLSSIEGFSSKKLKKAVTNDRSSPLV